VNVALNYRRQSKRRREAAIEDVIADAAEHGAPLPLQFGKRDRALERFPERKLLRDALQQLTHDHEQIIYLHDFLGFHYKEISAIIGCSAGLCKGRHFNAVKNLKRLLGTQK
jgi:RNA polymerase sigma factor (sigma-70 family)